MFLEEQCHHWEMEEVPRTGCLTKLDNWYRRALVREATLATLTEIVKPSTEMGEPPGETDISEILHQSGFYGRDGSHSCVKGVCQALK